MPTSSICVCEELPKITHGDTSVWSPLGFRYHFSCHSVHCTCFKLHTPASKGKVLSCEKKKGFLNPSIHLFIPHCFTSDHTEFKGFYTCFQCAEADIQRTDLPMCICASTDNWVWSPQFIQLPFAFTQITPGIYKCNRRDSRTIWTSSDSVHKIQLHRNSVACMSNLANFILIIQTNTGISTFSSLILFYLLSWILHLLFLFSLFHHIWLFSVGVHGDTLPSVHNACANFHISKMGSGILRSFPYVTDIIAY